MLIFGGVSVLSLSTGRGRSPSGAGMERSENRNHPACCPMAAKKAHTRLLYLYTLTE